jgi:radical SAM-linked protein
MQLTAAPHQPVMRIRVTFTKTGPLIYIGNLDLLTIWERTARRADLPLAYTHAFHPQPKIHLAAPLPLGFSSRAEVLDMRLNEEVEAAGLQARVQAALPPGISVLEIRGMQMEEPALQTQVQAAEYEVSLSADVDVQELKKQVVELLGATTCPRQRRGKNYDLRPLIETLEVASGSDASRPSIRMRLSAREGATGRPDEVLEALGVRREDVYIERTGLIFRD